MSTHPWGWCKNVPVGRYRALEAEPSRSASAHSQPAALNRLSSGFGRARLRRLYERFLHDAGGGVRGGHTIGATDELGLEAVECVHPLRDVHVTLLRLLGLDDNRLTYYHAGRFKQLSQFGGQVIHELIA